MRSSVSNSRVWRRTVGAEQLAMEGLTDGAGFKETTAERGADQNHSEGHFGLSYHFRKEGEITQVSANCLSVCRNCLGGLVGVMSRKPSSRIARMGKRGKRREAEARKAKKAVKGVQLPQESGRPIIQKQTQRHPLLRTAGRKTVGVWSAIVTGVGLLGVLILRPDISIEPYATTDPTRPFEQQFSIQNTSVYSIHEVMPQCRVANASGPQEGLQGVSVNRTSEIIETLEPNAKTTMTCNPGIMISSPLRPNAIIVSRVAYKVPFGIGRCKAERFRGKSAAGGSYVWTYDGSEKCSPP